MGQATSSLSPIEVSLLGIRGMQVLLVWEFAAERHIVVETPENTEPGRECKQRGESGGGRPTVEVRDLPAAGKATRLKCRRREWRCRDCRRSWHKLHPETPPRAMLTGHPLREAARQVGELGLRFTDQGIYTVLTRPCVWRWKLTSSSG